MVHDGEVTLSDHLACGVVSVKTLLLLAVGPNEWLLSIRVNIAADVKSLVCSNEGLILSMDWRILSKDGLGLPSTDCLPAGVPCGGNGLAISSSLFSGTEYLCLV